MKNKILHLKIIYFPYILCTIFILAFLIAFRWLFEIYFNFIELSEIMYTFWIPFFIPIGFVFYFMHERIKIINLTKGDSNGRFAYKLLMGTLIFPLAIQSLVQVELLAYDLKSVRTVDDILPLKKEKFFKVANFNLDKSNLSYAMTIENPGKYNKFYICRLFFAIGFKEGHNKIWYGKKYEESVPSYYKDSEREKIYEGFWKQCTTEFSNMNRFKTKEGVQYFRKASKGSEKTVYTSALKEKLTATDLESIIILIPERKIFSSRMNDEIYFIIEIFGVGLVILFFMVIVPSTNSLELKKYLTQS